ncbi:hypothetical protein SCLCIDRAFT_1212718 [Scleroderma citrinum Foug A]|uniref:Uncharacterized protein n=1 Tax=Scleroderma citrinum Foug A TaxID=1036808 RepID=A0A0C3E9J2_9AGAM|nr:hypothetical protein SCLCIDRAFT_1212718 [Scleroderma citrinum Foug A]
MPGTHFDDRDLKCLDREAHLSKGVQAVVLLRDESNPGSPKAKWLLGHRLFVVV